MEERAVIVFAIIGVNATRKHNCTLCKVGPQLSLVCIQSMLMKVFLAVSLNELCL